MKRQRYQNKCFQWRGIRVGKRDDRLVLWSVISFTIFLILMVSCIFLGDKILIGRWNDITKDEVIKGVISGSVLSAVLLFLCYKKTRFSKLIKRQRIAKMLLENGWFESVIRKGRSNNKKITYFPVIYYRESDRKLFITVKITMGKYQDKLLHLENKLETGLACELIEKNMQNVYLCYTFLQGVEENRIPIEAVRLKDGRMQLMKHIYWDINKMPHMLISGGTGGGKTVLLMTLIEALLRTDAKLYIVDPKNMDLAYLENVMPDVHHEKDEILECIQRFYDGMICRTKEMKRMPEYRMGMNYAALGLSPHFLIFDEYVAFMDMLGKKEWEEPLSLLRKIIMLGRQAGYFLILACQRPDAKYLGDGIRDQFGFRAALGKNSDSGYNMMFGGVEKTYTEKKIPGRGYVSTGDSVVTEFYSPLVPDNYDFFHVIEKLYAERNMNCVETKSITNDTQ